MQLLIPCPLTLPDRPLSLVELETAVHAWRLARAWRAQAALRPPVSCLTCDVPQQQQVGAKARTVETHFGSVWLTRQRIRCQACDRYFQAGDAALTSLPGTGRCTPMLRELAAQRGTSWPYRQAAQVLALLRGVSLVVETVRQIVAETGGAVERQYADEARRTCQPPATVPPPAVAPARLAVILDRAWIHRHDNAHGMAIKVGDAYRQRDVWRDAHATDAAALCGNRTRNRPV